jgi:hypothetical protein
MIHKGFLKIENYRNTESDFKITSSGSKVYGKLNIGY